MIPPGAEIVCPHARYNPVQLLPRLRSLVPARPRIINLNFVCKAVGNCLIFGMSIRRLQREQPARVHRIDMTYFLLLRRYY